MLRSSTILFVLITMLVLPGYVSAQENTETGPRMSVPEKVIDLGDVVQGQVVEAEFKFINEGQETLEIKAVRPTCGCTVADFDREIAPGETGAVRARLDTKDFAGPIAKAIMVMTNNPEPSNLNLVVKANVRPIVEILPRALVSFNALKGEGAEEKIVVVPAEDQPDFAISAVDGGEEVLETSIRKLSGDELVAKKPTPQYEVTITVKDDAPIGPVNQELVLHTNNSKAKEVPVKVYGVIRSVLQVSPTQIQFGTVDAAAGPGQYVMVANNRSGSSLAITSAKVDDPAFAVEVRPVAEGKRYQVVVTVKRDATPGSRDAKLVLTTNEELHPTLTIPVRAKIR